MLRTRFSRFVISGGVNTAITFGLYLALLNFLPYQISYTICYITGIAISYTLNRSFVFKNHRGIRSLLLFPMVYVAQYALGLFLIWLWVEEAGLSDKIAPLVVVAVTIPVTYVLTRLVFVGDALSK